MAFLSGSKMYNAKICFMNGMMSFNCCLGRAVKQESIVVNSNPCSAIYLLCVHGTMHISESWCMERTHCRIWSCSASSVY